MDETKELTPKQKTELRTGSCIAVACPERCVFYSYSYTLDHFDHCVCGHTQQAHAYAEGTMRT
jgi:hypothetical protein